MREIKYRVYDKHLKVIRDVAYIDLENKEIMYWIDEEQTMDIVRNFDEVELMQYTGLKDKHGKEIYEGDICKWRDLEDFNDEIIEDIFVVEWSDEFLKYIAVKDSDYHGLYEYTDDTDLEIIGNIYENPEILEVEE